MVLLGIFILSILNRGSKNFERPPVICYLEHQNRAKAAAKKNGNARRTIATTGMDYIITSSNASNMSILGC
ncbi:hypothetical protein LWI28_001033 [Acer negundo]|uniref:Secreted protein n=1 Tax=Acer negundo TaxID=4023 RepID=A0AAD5I8L9_ACENE|nr:hypothetical protein LWI28_001033 [Acer negundo]